MFFVLSKVIGFFAIPSNVLIALALLGVVLMGTRFARGGRRLVAICVILLAVFGVSPLGNALIMPLEERFPPWDASRGAPTGIVVLGGALDDVVSGVRPTTALNDASERLTETVALARRYPSARIVYSGGYARLIHGGTPETEFAKKFFADMGIAPERLLLEDQSRNTSENAIYSKRIADPKPGERWLLVTSAWHMPRSMAIFRHEGFPVEAYPVDWRTRGPADLARGFDRAAEGLRRTDIAVREWVGLVVYRLTGRTSDLFPRP